MSKWIIIFLSEDSIYFLYVHTEGISDIFKCVELYMQIELRSHAIFIPLYCDINLFTGTSSFIRMYRNLHPVFKPIWSLPMFEMYQNVNYFTNHWFHVFDECMGIIFDNDPTFFWGGLYTNVFWTISYYYRNFFFLKVKY